MHLTAFTNYIMLVLERNGAMSTKDVRETALSSAPELVQDDSRPSDNQIDPPGDMRQIGMVVHWEGNPSFLDAAGLLDPGAEVRPGQFVAIWHGRRGRKILTIVQVANSREINPNEVPELAAARQRLGLPSGYAQEGISTRNFPSSRRPYR